jgi:hypothetical protein
MESDIKLVSMGDEVCRAKFGDLDANQIPQWCRIESRALQKGLDLLPEGIDSFQTRNESLLRAYRLIGKVRQRAKIVPRDDAEGRHYFASILFWNLSWLKLPAVRRTKKVLALYSASEILDKYRHAA